MNELRKPRFGRGNLSSGDVDAGKPDSDGAPLVETFEWLPFQEPLTSPHFEAGESAVRPDSTPVRVRAECSR